MPDQNVATAMALVVQVHAEALNHVEVGREFDVGELSRSRGEGNDIEVRAFGRDEGGCDVDP